jgi:hypothetical protein
VLNTCYQFYYFSNWKKWVKLLQENKEQDLEDSQERQSSTFKETGIGRLKTFIEFEKFSKRK